KDNFYIISIEIVFFSLIQELYVPDSISFPKNLLIMSVITLLYIVVIYLVSKLIFKKLQY
ncbi:hypothetical protein, partial [Staphylococcus haemolyticus]|uniref:hypothetical protein n=1 Tax=Staphylococcus haemolyticus TaxID=1283 RepID=UPI003C6F1C32